MGWFGPDFGEEAHLAFVFRQIQECTKFHKKGDRVKGGRWASWFDRHDDWRKARFPVLLVLLYYGIEEKKWWKDVSSCPYLDSRGLDMADMTEEAEAPADIEPGSVDDASIIVANPGRPHVSSASSSSGGAAIIPTGAASSTSGPRYRAYSTIKETKNEESALGFRPRGLRPGAHLIPLTP